MEEDIKTLICYSTNKCTILISKISSENYFSRKCLVWYTMTKQVALSHRLINALRTSLESKRRNHTLWLSAWKKMKQGMLSACSLQVLLCHC